jgi:hypothetical protein
MTFSKSLPSLLVALLPFAFVPACSDATSTRGQLITCATDPGTGVILRCEPGAGTGGAHECTDVDEDGDGQPTDTGGGPVITRTVPDDGGSSSMDDDDDDGIPDDEDCDKHEGEDDCDGDHGVDLPYDIKLSVGDMTRPIADAFAEKGAQPASIVSVTLDGGSWRLTELEAGTQFTVTQADCTHAGNRDTGRDRVVVTWKNADNSTHSDHLDIRYCDN